MNGFSMAVSTIVLFDIDGTLVEGSRVHGAAFENAFESVFGVTDVRWRKKYDGWTDPLIAGDMMRLHGIGEGEITLRMGECMEATERYYLSHSSGERIRILPGVSDLLETLARKDVMRGLVSGNLEKIARAKLERAGLDEYFQVGGFGSDPHVVRSDLVRLALTRAQHACSGCIPHHTFLVGDTPYDISAGQEAGVKTIGVATGIYPFQVLAQANVDFVLNDLTEFFTIPALLSAMDR
jgi:phosphoglycolate phosphatase-like HAD superfamily hydrolase